MVLFTLDTVFLHECQRELQVGEGAGHLVGALQCSGEQTETRQGRELLLSGKL